MALLEFKEIKKSFGKKEVLKDISFDIKEGEIFGLIGTSGSGKSTFLNILMGIVKQDAGEILVQNKGERRVLRELRRGVGFATQHNMLFEELTIKENSFYFGSLYGLKKSEIKKKFSELLKLLGLDGFENVPIENLSGGMMKRANFLVSLIHNPKLLILDEPTVGLDPLLRKILWKYIQDINAAGTTILITSHLLDEIEENCSRVAVLNGGKIIAIGSVKQYKERYGIKKTLGDIFRELILK